VFEHEFTGNISRFIDNPGAREYKGRLPLNVLQQYVRNHFQLPGVDTKRPTDIFERADIVLAKLEETYLYIFELEDRIRQLEDK
ncbi:MAG TPA: hypothetical protein PLD10_15945, partial [Rhodopila sp.]|nr:hypothetical protein [Rhodopila sp.]